ncbi:MAG: type II toxin-antitoxin system RelE/ParE family toxin [Cognatishimia sp.]|nr:type II toxin-antitoxin system RelE/ParE family toxin [Cognatishimia sp.]
MKIAKKDVAIDYIVVFSYVIPMKRIVYSRNAIRTLRKIPANTSLRIRSKIEAFARDPASQANNIKALKGHDEIRLRIGGWRVIMNDQGEVLEISTIAPRSKAY